MKILVVCQYYSPEPFRVADICETLVKEGHRVDVITSLPNYPMGKIYEGYRDGSHKDEVINGVKVHRVFTVGRRTGAIFRFINYYVYALAGSLRAFRLKEKYDAVLVYQLSPVMMTYPALVYKKKHGTPVLLYCLDLWPESLRMGGINKESIIYKFFERVSKKIYCAADKIFVSSKSFIPFLGEKYNIDDSEICYLPQFAEDIFSPVKTTRREKLSLTFAGNIGTAQSLETIVDAAALLRKEEIVFNIVGDGSELKAIKKYVQDRALENVVFYGRRPLQDMPEIFAESDGMLVTLSADEVLSRTLPGKVQSYMAAGKPIIGAINGECARVIIESGAGFCAPAEDAEALADCIRKFISADKAALEKCSYEYYCDNFMKDKIMNTLIQTLEQVQLKEK